MKVWEIKKDYTLLSSVTFNVRDYDIPVMFYGERYADKWQVPRARFYPTNYYQDSEGNYYDINKQPAEPIIQITDFPGFVSGALLCSEKAASILLPFVDKEVEVLPVNVEGHSYTLLNVVNVIDCVDLSKTRFKDSFISRRRGNPEVLTYAFHTDKLEGVYLFKTPYRMETSISAELRHPCSFERHRTP